MSDVVIKAEGLGKKYLIGHQSERERYTALRDVLAHNVRSLLNKTRQVLNGQQLLAGNEIEEFWALRDIDFEIKRGDRVGIIGRNGAGKSTLLKILSRITEPSEGKVTIQGRVASLLEVGTGFHPELTGRENIFLNGTILGMTRAEIKIKFDEIVNFAGVEKFLDTPVKRYSSGMYVRLAFAVAAHLEPEILIVDEVLAVGDAEFQKKCLGKMEEVSKNDGRTVLFVSHNLSAIETLCNTCFALKSGRLIDQGRPQPVINNYLQTTVSDNRRFESMVLENALGNKYVKILNGAVENTDSSNQDVIIDVTDEIDISFTIVNLTKESEISVGFDLKTIKGDTLFGTGGIFKCEPGQPTKLQCRIPGNFLNDEIYQIFFYVHTKAMQSLLSVNELLIFEVKDIQRENGYLGKINGLLRPKFKWTTSNE